MSMETIGTHVAAAVLGAWFGVFVMAMCRASGEADTPASHDPQPAPEQPKKCRLYLSRRGFAVSEYECSACGKFSATASAYERCPRCGAEVVDVMYRKGVASK